MGTVTVQVGDWNHQERVVEVDENSNVAQAFTAAGMSVDRDQSIRTFNTNQSIAGSARVMPGEVYILTENHTSG